MLLITCPYCGPRPELEFRNMGEAHIARPRFEDEPSDEEWAAFLYLRANPRGLITERWRHVHGCARFFNAVRHTVSDLFAATYGVAEDRPDLDALAQALLEREAKAIEAKSLAIEAKSQALETGRSTQ